MEHETLNGKVALITGGARRIGATVARVLHEAGMNLSLHYRSAGDQAMRLQRELNDQRSDSVMLMQADLRQTTQLTHLVENTTRHWGRLDLLLNNASSFFPTPLQTATESQWDYLMGSNLKAPFFLAQAAASELRKRNGNIVNIVDIYAERPLQQHIVYCVSKAGLAMLTKSLAQDLGPEIRVNGIAPGAILWPEHGISDTAKDRILSNTALKRLGTAEDIATTVLFLVRDGAYITGQIIQVDGGRNLFA